MSLQVNLSVSSLTAVQRTAIQTAAPIIKTYLRRCLRVWRRLTPEQRTIFLSKNPALANIVEAITEAFE